MKIDVLLKSKKAFVLFFVIIVLIVFHSLNILNPLENLIINFFSPVQKAIYAAASSINQIGIVKKLGIDLVGKNIELENNYKKILVENLNLKNEINELKTVVSQFKFYEQKKYSFELANIIGKDIVSDSTYLIIDKGSDRGIKAGHPVVSENGMFVGKIIEANSSISKAMLLIDTNSHTSASLKDNNKIMGIVSGDYKLGLKMELIPQDENILNGNIIVTSGLDEYIPSGLIIGEVIKINKEPNNFFQTAYIQPIISYATLRIITILKTY
ncbi:MAG: Cell shape-determining protein MreC [Parcubacteria group bacterium GW2011_GWA2_38_13]|nr:MAG: Cell shape-determining protein MreC [Parcubacteria group bacterium GW2011_GWA2_38_13]